MIKVGIDIGNSKISCIVVHIKENKQPKILSFVSLPTNNIIKSAFLNFSLIKNEIKEVLDKAAKESQTEIKSINLNVPLIGSSSFFYNSSVGIDNQLIDELHLKKAINESQFFQEDFDKIILMNYIINYQIDGKITSINPIGNFANNLILNFYKLSINQNIIHTYKNLFDELNIHIDHLIPTPLSSGLATLNEDDKDLGSICIDLGESSTALSIFENKKLIFCDSISIGSKNITNDITRGISTTKESAERLKTLYGSVLSSPSDEYEIIEVPLISPDENQFKQINRSTINSIIKPRVEETLELIWQKLKQYNFHKRKIKNLILTGGGSQLDGICEYAEIIFDSNVRIGRPYGILALDKQFSGPQFSQTIGTILYNQTDYEVDFLKKSQKNTKNTVFSRFTSWLDQYI